MRRQPSNGLTKPYAVNVLERSSPKPSPRDPLVLKFTEPDNTIVIGCETMTTYNIYDTGSIQSISMAPKHIPLPLVHERTDALNDAALASKCVCRFSPYLFPTKDHFK